MTTRLTELELELADAEAAYHAARHRLDRYGVRRTGWEETDAAEERLHHATEALRDAREHRSEG